MIVKLPCASVRTAAPTAFHSFPISLSSVTELPASRGLIFPVIVIGAADLTVAGADTTRSRLTETGNSGLRPSVRSHVASDATRIAVLFPTMTAFSIFPSIPEVAVASSRHVESPCDLPSMRIGTPATADLSLIVISAFTVIGFP